MFSYDNSADTGNIRNQPDTGGGGIRDIGVYTYSSVRFATGAEPVDLTARVKTENGVDTWAQVVGEMDGPTGRFTYSAMTSMRLPQPPGGGVPGRDRHDHRERAVQRRAVRRGRDPVRERGGTIRTEQWPTANQYVLQVENFARTRARRACPIPVRWSSAAAPRR